MPRPARRLVALAMDAIACVLSVWFAFSIRLGEWDLFGRPVMIVAVLALFCWFLIAWWTGIYRAIIRSAGGRTIVDVAVACLLLMLPMLTIFSFVGVDGVPRTIGVLQPILLLLLLAMSRVIIRYALVDVLHLVHRSRQHRVAIYGAGRAGQQLGLALRHESHLTLACYFDDDHSLTGDLIDGARIHSARDIGPQIGELGIDEILLALPSVTRGRRLEIVEELKKYPVRVRSLPSIGNIIDGQVSIRDLKEIRVEDLLGRDPVPPDEQLLGGAIRGKVVLVSGAGGSIGAELCRQVMMRHPRCLVLVEQSEFALYTILSELEQGGLAGEGVAIVPQLADVSDGPAIQRIMAHHRPDTVFHAAAYKHVPLVEANPISGLRNNIMGTYHCCIEAERAGASRFILVSTDKAVRPTNIMGASKRVCELVVQARADEGGSTIFSIVRFGNVLSSSGSVVPRFQAQINAGGPVTLTHVEVTRYFMTIPEAAQLVMQAGAMARGGEVFVLDMGQPIRIIDLARSMIQLSGCTVRDDENPDGDIVIEEIGLRPGEKMYEELLIGDNPEPTEHGRIMRAREKRLEWTELAEELGHMSRSLEKGDSAGALTVVRRLVPDYTPATPDAGYDAAPLEHTLQNRSVG